MLLTQRPWEELKGTLVDPLITYHRVPTTDGYDGFLATSSLLTTATLLARVYAQAQSLPAKLPSIADRSSRLVRKRLLVLSAPGATAVAYDIEARFNETGLADVELTDYRNFAHGRHYGLVRRLDETTVIALSTTESQDIAERTLKALPPETEVIRLHSSLAWPASALELFVHSAKLIEAPSARAGLDPARPSVPAFGRRLYHLSARRTAAAAREPVERKVTEAVRGGPSDGLYKTYLTALQDWLEVMNETRFSGVILDYDGTVCATSERFGLPNAKVRGEIERLLSSGIIIGFASGRGGSLYRDLRDWVPPNMRPNVYVGLYNGSITRKLTDPPPSKDEAPAPALQEAYDRLKAAEFSTLLNMTLRTYQLRVEPSESAHVSQATLYAMVASILDRRPGLAVTLLASGHSLDIIQAGSGKTKVYDEICRTVEGKQVITVGDQGQLGGNDYGLLACSPYSLSVDRCSADPTRCWNLVRPSERGPEGLAQYLRALQPRNNKQLRLVWNYK